MKNVLAFDFGASGGRAIMGSFDGEKIALRELHRFSNDPVMSGGVLSWDVLRLFYEIEQGLSKAGADSVFDSVGIDTWGVDFGLLDRYGSLLANPVHYRDRRTAGIIDEASRLISKEKMYSITGIQFMEFNTVFQLYYLAKYRPELLAAADRFLFMPDLLGYMLTGEKTAEYSIATTSQMVDLSTGLWSGEITRALGIPDRLFCDIRDTGSVLGRLTSDVSAMTGVKNVPVISVAGHDTQSAITAVPSPDDDFCFLSSGTWSLFGAEPGRPITNETARAFNVTNEGGYGRSTAFLKNICGLWLIQESRRQFAREGRNYSYADLEREARGAEPFARFIDPDDPSFTAPGDMPGRIREYCRRTGQSEPQTVGEIMRCVYESLALKYRTVFEGIKKCTGRSYSRIHVVGGGVKDGFLCRMTADSCGVPVYAGPIEATVMGNVAVQLMAAGEISGVTEARKIIAAGEKLTEYRPENTDEWEDAWQNFTRSTQ